MRYFIDAEFIETPPGLDRPGSISLISIAMVREDGPSLYCISNEFNPAEANEWVRLNVLSKLPSPEAHKRQSLTEIKFAILNFIGADERPRFWGYFSDYDWVTFCWIFGAMIDLPKSFPMWCLDLKQTMYHIGMNNKEGLPKPNEATVHTAIADAIWTRDAFLAVQDRIAAQNIGIRL